MEFHEFFMKLYGKTAPRVGELCVAVVSEIKDVGVYVTLLEYGKVAYVPIREVAASIPRHIRDVVREGQQVVCKIQRVKMGGEIINASLRRVTDPERQRKIAEFKKLKRVYEIFRRLSEKLGVSMDELIEKLGKPLVERSPHPYDGLEAIVRHGKEVLKELDVPPEWHDKIYEFLKSSIKVTEYEIKKEFKIWTLAPDAILRIKRAFEETERLAPGRVKWHYVSAPRYELHLRGPDIEELRNLFERIKETVARILFENNKMPTRIEVDGELLRPPRKAR